MSQKTKKQMTYKQFLSVLRGTKGKFKWSNSDGCLRMRRKEVDHCPITAVHLVVTSRDTFDENTFQFAADEFGLSYGVVADIFSASNRHSDDLTAKYRAIRRELLRAVGLREDRRAVSKASKQREAKRKDLSPAELKGYDPTATHRFE